jgi:hypothetical protein
MEVSEFITAHIPQTSACVVKRMLNNERLCGWRGSTAPPGVVLNKPPSTI